MRELLLEPFLWLVTSARAGRFLAAAVNFPVGLSETEGILAEDEDGGGSWLWVDI